MGVYQQPVYESFAAPQQVYQQAAYETFAAPTYGGGLVETFAAGTYGGGLVETFAAPMYGGGFVEEFAPALTISAGGAPRQAKVISGGIDQLLTSDTIL